MKLWLVFVVQLTLKDYFIFFFFFFLLRWPSTVLGIKILAITMGSSVFLIFGIRSNNILIF